MKPRHIVILLALSASGCAALFGGGADFDAVVTRIERQYGIQRVRIPLFGLVSSFVKVARPAGAREVKLAVFEHPGDADGSEFHELVRSELGAEWRSIVRVYSRRACEWTSVYVRESGPRVSLMIATYDPDEATLVQIKLKTQLLAEWLREPERIGERVADKRH